MVRPMILSDETRPTDYTFANSVATHVQTDQDMIDGSTPDEPELSNVTCGLQTWRYHLVLHRLCLPRHRCLGNHILMSLPP